MTFERARQLIRESYEAVAQLPAHTPDGHGALARVRCHLGAALLGLQTWADPWPHRYVDHGGSCGECGLGAAAEVHR